MQNNKKNTLIGILIAIIPIINTLWIHSLVIGVIFGFAYIIWWSFVLSHTSERSFALTYGLLALLSLFIASTYAVFYLYKFTPPAVAAILLIIPVLITLRRGRKFSTPTQFIDDERSLNVHQYPQKSDKPHDILHSLSYFRMTNKINTFHLTSYGLLVTSYLILITISFHILFRSQTDTSILSPWQAVPSEFFIIYFLTSLALVASFLFRGSEESRDTDSCSEDVVVASSAAKELVSHDPKHLFYTTIPLLQISLHTFLTASIALIVYRIGYGFDPFVHRATEELLINSGTISPKPFMYIGQYGLVTLLHHLTQIPLALIDKLLVPLLGSLLLPPILFHTLSSFRAPFLSFSPTIEEENDVPSENGDSDDVISERGLFERQRVPQEEITSSESEWLSKQNKTALLLTTLLTLTFSFNFLTLTVPQNLANIFLIILIFLGFTKRANINSPLQKFLALWGLAFIVLFIHPLSGIPALLFAYILTIQSIDFETQKKYILKYIFKYILPFLSIFIIPAFFFIASLVSSELTIKFSNQNLFSLLNIQAFNWLPGHSLLHHAHLATSNHTLIYLFLSLIGITSFLPFAQKRWWKIFKSGDLDGVIFARGLSEGEARVPQKKIISSKSERAASKALKHITFLNPITTTFLILLINLFLSQFIKFSSLPISEQDEFARRLFEISLLFLLPYAATGIYKTIQTFNKTSLQKLILLLVISSLLLVTTYSIYPRTDTLAPKARGYATSQSDIEAVRWIENDAKGKDYVVLANQVVSATALQELGFKKYYNIQTSTLNAKRSTLVFFYPIPTGGPLYDVYLDMVHKIPDKTTALKATELTGVETIYFVLNDYWLDAEKIKTAAKNTADNMHKINEDKITIFKYNK